MLSYQDKKKLQELIDREFSKLSEAERKEMVEELVNKNGAQSVFCEYIGEHVSKIGVRICVGDIYKGKVYCSTEYDDERFDL